MNQPLLRAMGEHGPFDALQTVQHLSELIARDAVHGDLPSPDLVAQWEAAHAGLTAQIMAR